MTGRFAFSSGKGGRRFHGCMILYGEKVWDENKNGLWEKGSI